MENSQSYITIGTTQDEENSHEETETLFDKQKSKAQQRKQSVTFA